MKAWDGVVLVVDVESTCWEKDETPSGPSEIIEVGIAEFNAGTLEVTGRPSERGILVRPSASTVSEFCTKLTGLKQEDVENAPNFQRACWQLRAEHKSEDRPWASWGEYDRTMFRKMAELAGGDRFYPFGSYHINLKALFSVLMGLDRFCGLGAAVKKLGIPFEGTAHTGNADAYAGARILRELSGDARARGGL